MKKEKLIKLSQNKKQSQKINKKSVGFKFQLIRLASVIVIFSMLAISIPAAPRTIAVSGGEVYNDIRFAFASGHLGSFFGNTLNGLSSFLGKKGKSKRNRNVNTIKILPGDVNLLYGQRMSFAAVAYSYENEPINGVKFNWTVEKINLGEDEEASTRNLPSGHFMATEKGDFVIKATTEDGFVGEANIKVKYEGHFADTLKLKDDKKKGHLIDINRLISEGKYTTSTLSSKKEYLSPQALSNESFFSGVYDWFWGEEKTPRGPNAGATEIAKSSSSTSTTTALMRPADEDGWDDDNWWMADDPANQVGNPPGSSPDASAGNGNFQFSTPVVSLPGRGINVNLSLHYNSRVWSKDGTKMTYDSDRGFPAPGWSIGFGKMIFVGTSGGCILVDADGTRHGYSGTITNYTNGGYTSTGLVANTTDGTFIDYECNNYMGQNGVVTTGEATLPNGTKILYENYSANGDQAFPTRITDAQGNYITITYVNNSGPEIDTITDTLGRIITFNYDTSDRLLSVDVPKFTSGTRTAVRLHYKSLTLSPGFASGYTTNTITTTPQVIDSIFYPGTSTGYWFNDSDSYSSYGMIAKVKEMRGMTSTGTNTSQGTVTAGTMSKEAVYDYPLTADYTLTDAPTFPKLTETWAGMDTAPAETTYDINFDATPRTITVTQPNGLKSKQYMKNNSGQWDDGLLYKDETLDASNNVLNKSEVTWEEGDYDSPRPTITEITDEKGQKLKTVNTYGTSYNQITSVKEYDYNGTTLIRDTQNTYINTAAYTNRHIFNLVSKTEAFDTNNAKVAKIEYEYDGETLQETENVVMFEPSHDPYNMAMYSTGNCLNWEQPPYGSAYCTQWEVLPVYDSSTASRGNVTATTSYSDAAGSTGAVIETRKYDATGNMVEASSSCCEVTKITYDISTQFAFPVALTRGPASAGANQNTTTSVYDLNTGLIEEGTDANGIITTTTYDVNTLRPIQQASSIGGYTQYTHDESAMKITTETKESNGTLASKNIQYLNGIGQVVKEEALGANNEWDIVETQYTKLGQVWKQTRPYRSGQTKQWLENFYDIQGRYTKILGADGSYTEAFYNESSKPGSASSASGQTIRVADAWGRERWGRYNAQGKLEEVVEPNPDGNGSVTAAGHLVTNYTYDSLGRLTQTNQGGQLRKFKYDDLNRLTRQKLAEQTATINDSGTYIGPGVSGANWSEALFYDDRSNLIQKTDARGVKTHYSYQSSGADDPLNRIQSVSYDLSGPRDTSITVHAAPSVTYEYMTTGDKKRIKKIRTAGFLTEDYSYDTQGRVSVYEQTVDYRTSYPMTTSYTYDTLSRVTEVRYPAQYGLTGNPRKLVSNTYDAASRVSSLKVDGQEQAGNFVLNASSQVTSVKIGPTGANQVTETYSFDDQTGLMTNQKVKKGSSTLLDLSYDYQRLSSSGTLNGKTKHITKITNNLNSNKNREYKYDAFGRLTLAKGGTNNLWTQTYTYDRYGNRTNVTASGVAADNTTIPLDGNGIVSYDAYSNRIDSSGYTYDAAGNQTKAKAPDGTWVRYEYDAANRLQAIKKDSDGSILQAFQYGSSNARLMDLDYGYGYLKIFASVGGTNLAEYTEFAGAVPTWTKSYIYLGNTVLSTLTKSGSTEVTEFNHSDQRGIRTITNQQTGTDYEQTSLPFGTALNAESTTSLSKRFTSYERSNATGLDYAINRTYDSKQGRFTQVDPIGMGAVSLASPQTLNLYTYCGNDPINHTDPSGLFFGFFKKLFKWVLVAVAVVVAVLTIIAAPPTLIGVLGAISAGANAASQVMNALGFKKAGMIFGLVATVAGFGGIIAAKIETGSFISDIGSNLGLAGAWYGVLGGVGAVANSFAQNDELSEKERWTIVEQTIARVIKRLKNNSKCLSTINNDGYDISPTDAIQEIFDRGNLPYANNIEHAAQTFPNQTNDGVIELGPSFFDKVIIDGRGNDWNKITGLNTLRVREFVILHELRHLFGSAHGDDIELLKKDITEILKDCFGVTPDFSGGIK